MAQVIKCEYIYSDQYRRMVNMLAAAAMKYNNRLLCLSGNVLWVENLGNSCYRFYSGLYDMGTVSAQDIREDGIERAIWDMIKYLELHIAKKWSVIVFPHNWGGTEWENKSGEFVVMNEAGARNKWIRLYKSFIQ